MTNLSIFPCFCFPLIFIVLAQVPSYMSEFVMVTAWVQDSGMHLYPNTDIGSKYNVLPNGELYINNVSPSDAFKTYTCRTINRLTGWLEIYLFSLYLRKWEKIHHYLWQILRRGIAQKSMMAHTSIFFLHLLAFSFYYLIVSMVQRPSFFSICLNVLNGNVLCFFHVMIFNNKSKYTLHYHYHYHSLRI